MTKRSRRSFRPCVDGFHLEARVALSASSVPVALAAPASAAAAPPIDPLTPPPVVTIKGGRIQDTLLQLHAAYQAFINRIERACQNATQGLANGQSASNLLLSFQTYTQLQIGNLQVQVQRVARTLPGGNQYLYSPPQGVLDPGTTYPAITSTDCGKDIRYFVPPEFRLQTQIRALSTALTVNATTLQEACGANTVPTILASYQSARAATIRFIRCSVKTGVVIVPGWG